MSFKRFDSYGGCLVFVFSFFYLVLVLVCGFVNTWLLGLYSVEIGGLFCFDVVSFYLCFLSLILMFSLVFIFRELSLTTSVFLFISLISSFLSYCCINGLWFWVFYEMSILPLLLLLILESPYSERYIASWYLMGYVVFTSLPMLLGIFYLSGVNGSLCLQSWFSSGLSSLGGSEYIVLVFLSVLFITKIPLPPFHVWLPIVHAEASSPVSVCLSGYIMKLGLLGVVRFSYVILSEGVFSSWYVVIGLWFAVLFFFSGARELDGKRWLAFLSLAHIVVAAVCLSVCSYDKGPLCYLFCLGHGVSAGVVFILLWLIYEVAGTRNWSILKCAFSGSLLLRCVGVAALCTVASIPPTVSFFSEVLVLIDSGSLSVFFIVLFSVYLFVSGLVPMFVVGGLLSRHYSISYGCSFISGFLMSVMFLGVWCYLLFLVF